MTPAHTAKRKRQESTPDTTDDVYASDEELQQQEQQNGDEGIFTNDKFYIIDVNLDKSKVTVPDLVDKVESNGGKIVDVHESNIIITNLRSAPRLGLHLPNEIFNPKSLELDQNVEILGPKWVLDSVNQGKRLDYDDYFMIETKSHDKSAESEDDKALFRYENSLENPDTETRPEYPTFNQHATLSCQMVCPLVSVNENLAARLALISKSRSLEGEDRSSLSYARAVASVKSVPHSIQPGEAIKLGCVGPKVSNMIEEYLDTGHITEADNIEKSTRFKCLSLFSKVYGVGPAKARHLYDQGCRTLDDISKEPHNVDLKYFEDFSKKIPRKDVVNIAKAINEHVQHFLDGAVYTICGGFRRGKRESNDIDIVFTHPVKDVTGIANKVVERLREEGILTDVIHTIHSPIAKNKTMFNRLEICLGVIKWKIGNETIHRRVDIIMTNYRYYYTAIVGWTGSTQFERDIRLAANKRGLKFDSGGITRLSDEVELVPKNERDVFRIIGIPWIPPTFRNANVSQ